MRSSRSASLRTFSGSASGAFLPQPVTSASAASASLCRDDRADIFSFERREHVAADEAVDHLQLLAPLRARQVLDDHALDDDIVEVAVDEILGGDARDVRRAGVLLGIVRVEAVL